MVSRKSGRSAGRSENQSAVDIVPNAGTLTVCNSNAKFGFVGFRWKGDNIKDRTMLKLDLFIGQLGPLICLAQPNVLGILLIHFLAVYLCRLSSRRNHGYLFGWHFAFVFYVTLSKTINLCRVLQLKESELLKFRKESGLRLLYAKR